MSLKILCSVDSVTECLTFDDSNVPYNLWLKKNEIISDELLAVRIGVKDLVLIKHNHYQSAESYWSVSEVDMTHCNIVIELPNPVNDFNYYNRVRNKLIKRVETILKKHYTSKNLTDSQGA